MARLIVMPRARRDVEAAIEVLSLPADTWARLAKSLRVLEDFPHAGRSLSGDWEGRRALTGPWGWMIAVYTYAEPEDEVRVITVQDSRSAGAPTGG